MPTISVEELNSVSLPFPSFQPNTIILSEQINDNYDELQYRTNLLITSYNRHLVESAQLETDINTHIDNYNAFVIETGDNFTSLINTINTNNNTINNRVTQEVNTLNNTIAFVDNSKADELQIKNTLLYLKGKGANLSVVDLSGLGGGTATATNIATQQLIGVADWQLEVETGMYYYVFKHDLVTSTPLIVGYEQINYDQVYLPCKVIDANSVKIYSDEAIEVFVSAINGSSQVELVQAIIDDENITTYRTWSSEKTKAYIDANTPVISASGTTFDNTSNGMTAVNVQDAIDEVIGIIGDVNTILMQSANILLGEV